jgi:hypothetical protein
VSGSALWIRCSVPFAKKLVEYLERFASNVERKDNCDKNSEIQSLVMILMVCGNTLEHGAC